MNNPTLMLRVNGRNFTAGALFEKSGGQWHCVKCAPILHWMKGKRPGHIRHRLGLMKARYKWMPVSGQASQLLAVLPSENRKERRLKNRPPRSYNPDDYFNGYRQQKTPWGTYGKGCLA